MRDHPVALGAGGTPRRIRPRMWSSETLDEMCLGFFREAFNIIGLQRLWSDVTRPIHLKASSTAMTSPCRMCLVECSSQVEGIAACRIHSISHIISPISDTAQDGFWQVIGSLSTDQSSWTLQVWKLKASWTLQVWKLQVFRSLRKLQVWKFKLTKRTPWTRTPHRLQNIGGCRADPAGTILRPCADQTQRHMGGKRYSV